ncbi:APC family permease [Lawsonia intracellularis]|uniref:APC family permease n=1 Tax=Lawsonia intracellularis TaxID=29546 RepID=UPI00215B964A|nr:APC family permease [Lawsonia intracellularis]
MNIWNVVSIGIGSMVGAGIFALLGQAILLVGKNAFISFILAGIISLLSGYSYAKLASRYPSSSGILEYYNKGFSSKVISGGFSLLYLFTLAISISMVAKTFGLYLAVMISNNYQLSIPDSYLSDIFSTIIIITIFLLNTNIAKEVGKAETTLVGIKVIILSILVIAGLSTIDIDIIINKPSSSSFSIIGSVGLTFFAYAGFGMMTNASGEVKNPKKTIPRAIFIAILFVMFLYTTLCLVVLGNIPLEEIKKHADTAIAIAARPVLGNAGFFIISVVALLATASGINAMMFSGIRIAKGMAEKKQLPSIFLKKTKFIGNGTIGMTYSIIGIIIITNIFNLQSIANMASIIFLLCYLVVFIANWKLRKETQSLKLLIVIGIVSMSAILLSFIYTIIQTTPMTSILLLIFLVFSFLLEYFLIKYVT